MFSLPEPTADLGDAAGGDPHHHPPAEPPPVPPGGMGADALPEADHPAQPAADPDRAAAAPARADRPARAPVLASWRGRCSTPRAWRSGSVGGGRTSQVVLVDDSLSMGYAGRRPAGVPPRPRGRRRPLLGGGRPAGPLHARRRPRPRARPSSTRSRGRAARSSRATPWRCRSPTRTPPGRRCWRASTRSLQSCTYPMRQLTIITDLRKAGWDAGVGDVARRWQRAGRARPGRRRRRRRGRPTSRSRRLVPLDRTILAGAETHWEATIRNDSPRVLTGAKAILRVDDRPTEVPLPEIPPRAGGARPADRPVPVAGAARHLAPAARGRAGGRQPALGGGAGQGLAPDPPGRRRAVVGAVRLGGRLPRRAAVDRRRRRRGLADRGRARRRTSSTPGSSRADVLVLANVAAPTAEQAGTLGQLVRGGMGLLIFTGAKLDTGLYNERLYRSGEPAPARARSRRRSTRRSAG